MPFQNPCDVLCGTGNRSPGEGQGDGLTPGTNMETAAPESRGPSQGLSSLQVGHTRYGNSNWLDHTHYCSWYTPRVLFICSFKMY